jgi:hypothetical protein
VFAGALVTNLDAAGSRRTAVDVGAQLDLRLSLISVLDLTVSLGAAVAFERDQGPRREAMFSLKILR